MCGANSATAIVGDSPLGSSPRVRGERAALRPARPSPRIIPACAGRTTKDNVPPTITEDHPRVCGANRVMDCIDEDIAGSSPRVRGEPMPRYQRLGLHRIIPACAGRTSCGPSRTGVRPDHPRVCGANVMPDGYAGPLIGSSPRVRGERARSLPRRRTLRIIPACAGRTGRRQRPRRAETDHPRVCGANVSLSRAKLPTAGSSPRVRGEHSPCRCTTGIVRIIPACAGRTSCRVGSVI